ncbi:dienelactone hydrolase family protein [Intrasporangium sp. YIM S08009]|uniref:dienelactone hydrolase family protein n=1 Tax=Intrasporangium zincisolvens TaxID=3080018 RepID=UPI002B05B709|nr:dienelactone hydrolase family protein [Intrasporangium sp. YIM S08009]
MGTMTEFPEHELSAYRADPEGDPRGAVVVVQEIWGLTDHITGVADRFAAEGYVAVAPDLLAHVGLTAEIGSRIFALNNSASEQERLAAQPQLREATTPARQPEFAAWAVPALRAVVDALAGEPGIDGRVGVVGFCFGGTYAFALAAADERVRAAVPFYGTFPEQADPATIACPVLALYGEDDHRITDGVPDLEARMDEAGVDFTARVYHGVGHAFFNDDAPSRYNADVAADAWQRTLAFLAEHVGR